jgi:hypothetical protein
MRKLFISVAALQFALSAATAQPATTSTATQSASLDKRGNVSKILANRTTKPLVHLEIVVALESAVVLPLVALHLLPPHLIAGATSESGIASVYAGGPTANGEQARIGGMTAAHRSIPFGTKVRVTNRANGKSATVRINDRGPFSGGRIIDLMPTTAKAGLFRTDPRYTCGRRYRRTLTGSDVRFPERRVRNGTQQGSEAVRPNVRFGSIATDPFSASAEQCPLCLQ